MNRQLGAAALTGMTVVGAAVLFGRSPTAHGQDDLVAIEADADLVYTDIAANDAAAARWRAAHPSHDDAALSDDELSAAANHGCPSGTQFWQRDRVTEVCAPPCASDADCAPEDGRCRILNVDDRSKAPEIVLVDDLPSEEVGAWLESANPQQPPLMVCDPFWDVPGALMVDE